MLTVSELAVQSNSAAHVIRYYTRIGLIKPAAQQQNGYRLYAPRDATRIRFIRTAKLLGFTLNEIKAITQNAEQGDSPCGEVRNVIQRHIVENRDKIEEMLELQDRMERALQQWVEMPDGIPDGHSVCHLIESFQSEVVNETNSKSESNQS